MTGDRLLKLLKEVSGGKTSAEAAFRKMRSLPFESLGMANVDHHRAIRQGVPEVILGEGKTVAQIAAIARAMRRSGAAVLVTRLSPAKQNAVRRGFREAVIHPEARCDVIRSGKPKIQGKGTILVVTAGTSDIPVAEEAVVTAEFLGNRVERLYDVGVAGIHRLLMQKEALLSARVLVVVGAMSALLPALRAARTRLKESREAELAALVAPEVRAAMLRHGVGLVNYAGLGEEDSPPRQRD